MRIKVASRTYRKSVDLVSRALKIEPLHTGSPAADMLRVARKVRKLWREHRRLRRENRILRRLANLD